jgi:hypothetical protein
MENATPSLWLHAYSGRENGLMIIGTPESMKDLAQQLLKACNQESVTETTPWPPAIATLHGRTADAPTTSMNQYVVAGVHLCLINQSLPGGDDDQRKYGGFAGGEIGWAESQQPRIYRCIFSEAALDATDATGHAEYGIALPQLVHAGA